LLIHLFFLDKINRSAGKTDQELAHQSSRDNSQINCFFKACDREASEKLLSDSYTCNILKYIYFNFIFSIFSNYLAKRKNGVYMLRQSNRDEDKFVLSLIKDGQCYHYRSHHIGNGTFLDEKTDSIFYCKLFI
jgi:hypothetical protein